MRCKFRRFYNIRIEPSYAQVGSGAQPGASIPSVAVTLQAKTTEKTTALLACLKGLSVPIIGRVESDKVWLDMRSLSDINGLKMTLEEL